jgi:KUP system potassium uptake protein
MATIRIADTKGQYLRTKTQDGVGSGIGDSIYRTQSFARSETTDTRDDIYNIRSRSKAPSMDRRSSRVDGAEREDDNPGLRKPGDYKQKQVLNDTAARLRDLRSILAGL